MKENTTNDEREFTFSETEYNALMAEQKEARMKNLRRHKLPADLSLAAALNGMTKQELEDIQYNLNLPMATNINRVKKDEMVTAILPEVVDFAGKWFVSAFDQQKELFDFFVTQKEAVTAKEISDFRLDYLRGIGVLFCGMSEGELLWYMPEEVKEAYGKINSGAYTSAVALNTEAMRLAAGFVFYYGIMDYDALHTKVNELLDEKLDFAEFMGVIFNGGCWYEHIIAGQHDLMSADLMNAEALQEAQGKQGQLEYAQFPYDKVYEAGDENYIESTAAYRALAQFFMKKKNLDVLQAAEAVKSITIILQNGYNMPEILSFLAENKLRMDSMAENDELYGLIGRFQHNQPLWMLKGHTPAQLENMPKVSVVREGNKVGRNDPCPCGSGKKFKKCCINKVY